MASTSATTAPPCTATSAYTSASYGALPIFTLNYITHTIPSSTNLDTWRTDHLRRMKVGGNAKATDFFSRHGGSLLLTDNDTKKKYSSKVAELYRAELDKRVEADTAQFPAGIYVEGATDGLPATAPAESADDDFFDSWDKAPAPKATSAVSPAAAKPPSIGRAATSPASNGPRTVTSASLRSTATASAKPTRLGFGASRLNSASSTGAAASGAGGGGGARKLGLQAKKAAPIDFEEAKKKAEEEANKVRQLGYDRKKEEVEAAAAKARLAEEQATAAKAASKELGGPAKSGLSPTPSSIAASTSKPTHQKGNSQDMARLGMGMRRLGLGSAAASPSAVSPSASSSGLPTSDEQTYAREHFGAQKGISSDMYFGRGLHDTTRTEETQQRLQQFQGATAISSAAYFGREDEEERAANGGGGDALGNLINDGSLEGIQTAARDAISRVMASPDVQNGLDGLRAGALKVRVSPC